MLVPLDRLPRDKLNMLFIRTSRCRTIHLRNHSNMVRLVSGVIQVTASIRLSNIIQRLQPPTVYLPGQCNLQWLNILGLLDIAGRSRRTRLIQHPRTIEIILVPLLLLRQTDLARPLPIVNVVIASLLPALVTNEMQHLLIRILGPSV